MPSRYERPGTPFGPDWQLRSLILRNQYGNSVINDVSRLLAGFYTELRDRLESGVDLSAAQTAQLESLTQWASSRLREVMSRARNNTTQAVLALGPVEAKALQGQAELLRTAMGLPSRAQLIQTARLSDIAAGFEKATFGGVNFKGWWERDAVSALTRIKATVQSGLLQGMGPREIARLAIVRDKTATGLDGIMERTHRGFIRMIVRTSSTAVSAEAAKLEYREMADVISEVELQAVLDARTSVICLALDGRRSRATDTHRPRPPFHASCRTTEVPVIDASVLGLSQAELNNRVTYDQWLRAQTDAWQNTILGKGKADYYRARKITLADLVRADGSRITLAELTRKLEQ